jgi:membrane protein
MLVSAVLSAGANTATGRVLGWVGLASDSVVGQVLLPIVGFVVVLVVDVGIFLVLLRLLSGVSMPWADLRQAAMLGAVGAGVLMVAVSYGIVGSSTNPVLASFAIVIGLLLVINLMSRVTLFAAAWAAVGSELAVEQAAEAAVSLARRLPHPRAMEPSFGPRSADRTAIAAGAVMGAVGAVGVGALRRAASAVIAGLRHRS